MTQHQSSREKQARILRALDGLDGRAHTGQIRETTGLSSSLIGYHMEALRGDRDAPYDEPLVELDGTEEIDDAPMPAHIYRLTDAGRDAVEELAAGHGRSYDEEIEELRSEIEQMKENFNELVDRLEMEG